MNEYKHLSYASSLCGNCTEVCPVRINLHELLLENRHIAAEEEHLNGFSEHAAWAGWEKAMRSRTLLNLAGASIKNKVVNKLFADSWGKHRGHLTFAPRSFNAMWKDRNK
jgi:L-lactate dehydrogenase complex protein LldF